jgi:wyosine [tRNA(Phe)-imidazoG37] synthetase (radical SAM superfamily)
MSIVYGPVPSWRLGRSLGIDAVSTQRKTCTFDCLYCQLGRTSVHQETRDVFVQPQDLRKELSTLPDAPLDTVTFSGVGEPTLASNLADLVEVAREFCDQPLAVLTNSSLIHREGVRCDLELFDIVVAKVDAPTESLFQRINRPVPGHSLSDVLEGIRRFREGFSGKLALQMMFIAENRDHAAAMSEIARSLRPDEVQLNTPLRPSPAPPLDQATLEQIEAVFEGLPLVNVYRASRPKVSILDTGQTARRRPSEGLAQS